MSTTLGHRDDVCLQTQALLAENECRWCHTYLMKYYTLLGQEVLYFIFRGYARGHQVLDDRVFVTHSQTLPVLQSSNHRPMGGVWVHQF